MRSLQHNPTIVQSFICAKCITFLAEESSQQFFLQKSNHEGFSFEKKDGCALSRENKIKINQFIKSGFLTWGLERFVSLDFTLKSKETMVPLGKVGSIFILNAIPPCLLTLLLTRHEDMCSWACQMAYYVLTPIVIGGPREVLVELTLENIV